MKVESEVPQAVLLIHFYTPAVNVVKVFITVYPTFMCCVGVKIDK